MAMIDLEDDKEIEKEKKKEKRNRKHDYCPKCGKPLICDDPECTRMHCSCKQLF